MPSGVREAAVGKVEFLFFVVPQESEVLWIVPSVLVSNVFTVRVVARVHKDVLVGIVLCIDEGSSCQVG